MTIFVGTRYDHYNDFGNNTSPRVALVYALTPNNTLKLMVGESFRAPNFLELFDRNNPIDFGNPELNAKKAKTLELAYGHQTDNGHYNVTLFRTSIESQIEFGQSTPKGPLNPFASPTFINASGSPTASGVELEFKTAITDSLMLGGGFSHFFSHRSGSPNSYGNKLIVPKNFGFITLNYTHSP
jgi:outer membrane receptor for ferrienterochelin and colicins